MRYFKDQYPQGDVYIMQVEALPAGVVHVPSVGGRNTVAHSESGHDHSFDASVTELYRLPDSIMECFVVVKKAAALEHMKTGPDAHDPVWHEPGIYRYSIQEEYTPQGMRRVED